MRATYNIQHTEISDLIASCMNLGKLDIDMMRPFDGNVTKIAETSLNHTEIRGLLASAPKMEHLILHYPSPDADIGGKETGE